MLYIIHERRGSRHKLAEQLRHANCKFERKCLSQLGRFRQCPTHKKCTQSTVGCGQGLYIRLLPKLEDVRSSVVNNELLESITQLVMVPAAVHRPEMIPEIISVQLQQG